MRILLAAKHAPHGSRPIGGVQSWCRTVFRELEDRGHDVETWGPEQPLPHDSFDLGIIANTTDTVEVWGQCEKRLVVCHGIIQAEKPIGECPVVYTSEEVRDHWGGKGVTLRQPIDLKFWTPFSTERKFLTRFSYRRGLGFLPELAQQMGFTLRHIMDMRASEARDIIRQSVCVLATGRAALEAMACGVPVVICDHRSAYQPALVDPNPIMAMVRNYSGRGGIEPNINNLPGFIRTAIERGTLRRHVEKHHNVVDIVDQLLEAAGC